MISYVCGQSSSASVTRCHDDRCFNEDIIRTLFVFVDTALIFLCLRHMDGTPTTREVVRLVVHDLFSRNSDLVPELLLRTGSVRNIVLRGGGRPKNEYIHASRSGAPTRAR